MLDPTRNRARVRCLALLYHHVGPHRPDIYPDLSIAPGLFERQISWLARNGYTGIRPAQWLAWLQTGATLPKKPVLLTFDDAYADIAEFALPTLRRYGFGASVFVVTARVGSTNTWDELQGYARLPLMTATQIREWAMQDIEFGAHSRTHAHLPELDDDALSDEIVGSRDELASLLGTSVTAFAYPFGEYSDAARRIVAANYCLGFSCLGGFNHAATDPFLLHRIYLKSHHSMPAFALIMRIGGLQRLEAWRIRLALRTRFKRVLGIPNL